MTKITKESKLTQEYVKEIFDYKEGLLYWKIKKQRTFIGKIAGHIQSCREDTYRRYVYFDGNFYIAARVIFMWHNGYFPIQVDHIDRNPLNDNIENLRAATWAQNQQNKRSAKNSTSKYKGVHCRNNITANRWVATIYINGKNKILGNFSNEHDAATMYNAAALIHHGEFANLNIIDPRQQ